MSDTTQKFKKQFPINSLFQLAGFCTQICVGLLLVPYLIQHIGAAAYGLIPLAGVMTQYANLISQSISGAVSRFLSIALQHDDTISANRVFSTAFFSYLAIGLLQIPLFFFLIGFADRIITIPAILYQDSTILLTCSAAAFVVNLVGSVFGVPLYAYNRLDILRGLDICRYLFRLVGIMCLFLIFNPSLRYVGYVDFSISLALFVAQICLSKRLAPDLRLKFMYFDWTKVSQLMGMGGWLLVNNIGALLFLSMDVWVCNRFLGAEAAGNYAAILQWPALIRQGGTIVSAIVAPMIMIYYAKGETDKLLRLSKASVRVLSVATTVPISLMCVFSPKLLSLWLGAPFSGLAPLIVLMVSHLAINVSVMPLLYIQVAMNKVKIPAMVTLIMGVINITSSVLLAKYTDLGTYGVGLSGAVILTVKNAFFTPIYAATILKQKWYIFIQPYLSALALLLGLLICGYVSSRWIDTTSLVSVIALSSSIGCMGCAAMWWMLPRDDKKIIISMLPARVSAFVTMGKPAYKG